VSFGVSEGETLGYIGPNGAGKSTTFKILAGILAPTHGTVRIGGVDPMKARKVVAANLGYLSGQKGHLWWDLPIKHSYELLRRIYGVAPDEFRARLDHLVDVMGLGGELDTPARQLSLGTRTRAELVASLLHRPSLALLDEPTIGLDVLAKERIYDFLRQIRDEFGTTIILASHDLRDVEALCERVLLIDQGRPIFDGTVKQIISTYATRRTAKVEFSTPQQFAPPPGFELTHSSTMSVQLSFDPQETEMSTLLELLRRMPVQDLTVEAPDLTQVVRQIYRESA